MKIIGRVNLRLTRPITQMWSPRQATNMWCDNVVLGGRMSMCSTFAKVSCVPSKVRCPPLKASRAPSRRCAACLRDGALCTVWRQAVYRRRCAAYRREGKQLTFATVPCGPSEGKQCTFKKEHATPDCLLFLALKHGKIEPKTLILLENIIKTFDLLDMIKVTG